MQNTDFKTAVSRLHEAIGNLVATCMLIPIGVAQGLYRAFVATKVWGWFIVPLGAPVLPLVCAYGASLLLHLYFVRWNWAERAARKTEKGAYITELMFSVFGSSLTWGVAWVAQHFFL